MRNEAEKTRSLKVAFVANAALLRRLATILGETSDKPEYTAFALSVVAILLLSLLNACQAPHQSTERTQTTAVSEPSKKEKPAAPWDYTKSEDALHGKSEDIFVLDGKYLSAPSISGRPKLVAICSKGKPEQLRLDTGVGLSVDSFLGFPVEKRLDGKFSRTSWSVYDNREDLSIPSRDFAQILAAHQLCSAPR